MKLDESWKDKALKGWNKCPYEYLDGAYDFQNKAVEELEKELKEAILVPECTNDDSDRGVIQGLEIAIKIIKELKAN